MLLLNIVKVPDSGSTEIKAGQGTSQEKGWNPSDTHEATPLDTSGLRSYYVTKPSLINDVTLSNAITKYPPNTVSFRCLVAWAGDGPPAEMLRRPGY